MRGLNRCSTNEGNVKPQTSEKSELRLSADGFNHSRLQFGRRKKIMGNVSGIRPHSLRFIESPASKVFADEGMQHFF